MADFNKGCDLCNNPTTKFDVWARGSIEKGVIAGALFEHHFEPEFCPLCGRKLKTECEHNETATKGE